MIILLSIFFLSTNLFAFENTKVSFNNFLINKYEVTIKEFSEYAKQKNIITLAEKRGGSFEWGGLWKKRKGWNYKNAL